MKPLISAEFIERRIYWIRGHKVMLDSDLADLYETATKRLNEQVRRNARRFPPDFMFELTPAEFQNLKPHFAASSLTWGGRRKLPLAFTQEGVAMLSSVLSSERAIGVNIAIMRAFVKLRGRMPMYEKVERKLLQLKKKINDHENRIRHIFDVLEELNEDPKNTSRVIGFQP